MSVDPMRAFNVPVLGRPDGAASHRTPEYVELPERIVNLVAARENAAHHSSVTT
jgi:hypothetical protein